MKQKSFTLIEILVVIVVIGVLSAFILVGMSSISNSANIAKSKAFANSLRNSLLINLIAEWKFNGPTNIDQTVLADDVKDSWGNNNCTVYNAPKVKGGNDCVSGKCISFNGTSDYLDCGNNVSIGYNSFTFSLWAKTSRNNTIQTAVQRIVAIAGYELQIQIPRSISANALFIATNGSYSGDWAFRYVDPYNNNSNTTDNKWHYYVGICDRTKHAPPDFYFDGIYQVLNAAPYGYCDQITDNIPAGAFRIGTGSGYFQGLIDEVAFYNAAISTSQIQQNYYIGINKLLKNNEISFEEFNQRLTELRNNLANN